MTVIPKPEKLTAEEYLRLTESMTERTELRSGQIIAMALPGWKHQRISMHLGRTIEEYIEKNQGSCTA